MNGAAINTYFDESVAIVDPKEQEKYPELVLDIPVKYKNCDAQYQATGNVRLFTNVAPKSLLKLEGKRVDGNAACANLAALGPMVYGDETAVTPTAYYYITGMRYSADHKDKDFAFLFNNNTCAATAAWANMNTTVVDIALANSNVAHYAIDAKNSVVVPTNMSAGIRSLRVNTSNVITMPALPRFMFLAHISMCASTINIENKALSDMPALAHVILRASNGTLGNNTFCKCPALERVQLFGDGWVIGKLGTAVHVNDTVIAAWYNNATRVNRPYTQPPTDSKEEQATTICATGAVYMSEWLDKTFKTPENTQTLILENIQIAGANDETTTVSLEIDLVNRQAKTDIATLVLSQRSSKHLTAAVDIVATEHKTDTVHNFTNDATAANAMAALCNGAIDLRTFRVTPVMS
ncbi:hypothetical protein [Nereida ignava]|uniref:hypothetical protein n=1 Tax=Nereida ignava TaxID=282199 RepID=UPI0030F625FF